MRLGMVISSWNQPCGVGEYGKALAEALQRLGQPTTVLPSTPARAASQARALGLDLVHFQYEYNLYDAGQLCGAVADLARYGVESVVTVHSWSGEADYANSFLRTGVPRFIATMPALRLAMQRDGIEASRVAVMPIGVRTYPLKSRSEARLALGLGGEPALGFFGFFHEHKGIENLGLAVRELRGRCPGLHCFLLASVAPNEGSRRAFEKVRAVFDAQGLWEGVSVHEGYLPEEEVVWRLHAMDVNVLPYEELRGVQASAAARMVLAALRPTVVTDTAHFSDLRDEVYKIEDNSPQQIATAVSDILDHPIKARALVDAAARLAARAGWDNVAAAHIRYYGRILTGSAGNRGRRPVRDIIWRRRGMPHGPEACGGDAGAQ